jgi:HSP20 family molecular chaperone IbpA
MTTPNPLADLFNNLPREAREGLGGFLGFIAGDAPTPERGQTAAAPKRTSQPVDVFKNATSVLLVADAPGRTQEAVDIEVEENILTVTVGSRDIVRDGVTPVGLGTRRPNQTIRYTYELPERADISGITADLASGELTVTIPVTPKPEPVKISVGTAE